MAQQTEAVWTEAQNADELTAGDDVRLRNTANGSVELEGSVRSALEGVGTVQWRTPAGRSTEVYAEGDGEWSKRGTCWTYTLEVRREVATDGGQERADASEAEQQALAPEQVAEGDTLVLFYETRASHGVHEATVTVTDTEGDEWGLAYEDTPSGTGTLHLVDGEFSHWRVDYTEARRRAERGSSTSKGSVVRATTPARHEWEQQASGLFCMACQEFHTSATPVNTGHGTTGEAGCPECLEADPLRRVVHEVGDERTVTYGYIGTDQRGHGSSITLEAAEAIAQQ